MVHYCSLGRASHCLLTSCPLAESIQKHLHGKLYEKCAKKDYFTYNFCFKENISRGNNVKISAVWSSGFCFCFCFLDSFFVVVIVVLTPMDGDARRVQEQVSVNKRNGDRVVGSASARLHINNQGAEHRVWR